MCFVCVTLCDVLHYVMWFVPCVFLCYQPLPHSHLSPVVIWPGISIAFISHSVFIPSSVEHCVCFMPRSVLLCVSSSLCFITLLPCQHFCFYKKKVVFFHVPHVSLHSWVISETVTTLQTSILALILLAVCLLVFPIRLRKQVIVCFF